MESDSVPAIRHRRRRDATEARHSPRLALLGGFVLTCDDRPLPLPGQARRLLALIAVAPFPLDRERAADRLWPEAPPNRSSANLRNALSLLHKACPELVYEAGQRFALAPALALDVQELTRLAHRLADPRDADDALLDADPRRFLGEMLPGWDDTWLAEREWLVVEREHLRRLALQALEQLALRLVAAGRLLQALDAAYLAVRADPLRESAVRVLIRVHFALGNRVDALRTFDAFGERLRRELGSTVGPLPETRRELIEGFGLGESPLGPVLPQLGPLFEHHRT
jgi:DNA-binding SARP family transcriptional activator